jgi:hypothetical protein
MIRPMNIAHGYELAFMSIANEGVADGWRSGRQAGPFATKTYGRLAENSVLRAPISFGSNIEPQPNTKQTLTRIRRRDPFASQLLDLR